MTRSSILALNRDTAKDLLSRIQPYLHRRFLMRLLWRMRKRLNWRLVRTVGELQILTRVSYVMLIAVPILASLWPGVRLIMNQYNQLASSSQDMLQYINEIDVSISDIQRKLSDIGRSDSELQNRLQEISKILTQIPRSAEQHAIALNHYHLQSTLPRVWAVAFFVALLAVVAHTLYQAGAPETIRRRSIEETVNERRDDFVRHSSSEKLTQACYNIVQYRSRIDRFEQGVGPYAHLVNLMINQKMNEYRRLLIQQEFSLHGNTYLPIFREAEEDLKKELGEKFDAFEKEARVSLIQEAARYEYLNAAMRSLLLMLLSLGMYLSCIYLVVDVIFQQTTNILEKPGLSIWSIFSMPF